MAEQQHHELIIVRRHEDEEHEHHSSAWKVAHADFMTAMMAFFLIMWLINVTDDEVKKSIANYFNPVKLSASVTDRKGLNDPAHVKPQGPEKPGDQMTTLAPPSGEKTGEKDGKTEEKTPEGGAADAAKKDAPAADPTATAEEAAFSDPYAALDKLAADAPPEAPGPAKAVAESGVVAPEGGDAYRDPFDPIYWQMRQSEGSKTNTPGRVDTAANVPTTGKPDATATTSTPDASAPPTVTAAAPAAYAAPATPADPARIASATQTEQHASEIAANLATALNQRLGVEQGPHIEVKATPEGILISLTDDIGFSMFEIGSAIPKPIVVVAMDKVADVLAGRPGNIVIRGYTDGRPFHSEAYDNWRLSTARAHMTQYMLTRDGKLPDSRIMRIEGFADRDLKNPHDPDAAENRRIEILLQEPTA